jgi:Xaa-Pro dipeptidase
MKRLDVYEKICKEIIKSDYSAIISVGSDNVQYLSGANLPFLYSFPDRPVFVLWPKDKDPCMICPEEWGESARYMSWIKQVYTYEEGNGDHSQALKLLTDKVNSLINKKSKIGVEFNRISNTLYKSLLNELNDFEVADCSSWLREVRMIKTKKEVALLEKVAYRVDHGIVGAAHHIIVTHSKTEMAFAEDIRVHCIERELDTLGHHSMAQAVSGEHTKKFWPLTERYSVGWEKMLLNDEIVRMSMISSIDGYWSDASRTLIMGEPTKGQKEAFQGIVKLREKAKQIIKPGIKSNEIYRELILESEKMEIKLVTEMGLGHGIGKTNYEPPYITEDDETVLKQGMVLVLDPVVYGPEDEILRSKDTVLVTDTGCRILGEYINWRAPYIAAYNL